MTDDDVERLLGIPPFDRMDPDRFPASAPLGEILRNDTRIHRYRHGDIIVREGDYGNSAFLILSGTVRVDISPEPELPAPVLGRRESKQKGLLEAVAQLWSSSDQPEVRESAGTAAQAGAGSREDAEGNVRLFLQDVPAVLERCRTVTLEEGELFGEVAALGRVPRTATVFSEGEAELLEIRWQGLRDIMRRDPELKGHIDEIYRERNLPTHILATPIFRHLNHVNAPDDCECEKCGAVREIVDSARLETWGDFDWHISYKRLVARRAEEGIEHEPLIAEEGHYPNGVILVRSGFARISRSFDSGHQTLSYLGRGQIYGFSEIVHNWRHEEQIPFQHSMRAVGYTAVVRVPTPIIDEYVLGPDRADPIIDRELLPPEISELETRPSTLDEVEEAGEDGEGVEQGILEHFVSRRFINGTATMAINMDRCTQCDDCVRACASTHDGNPRFVRHGPTVGNVMVANACMHCADPVCMIGCPTGAIHRDLTAGEVVINDTTCIGCATCANSCPYDNIRMVDIRNEEGEFILDVETGHPIQKATKCDLCSEQLGGPACQRACPHDALFRVDLTENLDEIAEWAKL